MSCGSESSSSGSSTLSEEEEMTPFLDRKVSGDGDDGHNSDFESVNEVEGDKETPREEESEDEDEKVNTQTTRLQI